MISQLSLRERVAMLFRIVNWFFFVLCVQVYTLQGENAPVDNMDYGWLKKFPDGQIPFLKEYRNKRDMPFRIFSDRIHSSANPDSGVQELSEFFVGNIKCTRYCVEKKTTRISEEGTRRLLNLVWTFASGENEAANASTPIADNILIPEVIRKNVQSSKNSTSRMKRCELYLVVDCDIPKTRESVLNKVEKKFIEDLYPSFQGFVNTSGESDKPHEILIEKNDLKYTETKFQVKNSAKKLSIIILGNISKIDLEIPAADQDTPLGWNEKMKIPNLMLSLTRMTETMGVRLNARNPPSGEWCLKLTPVEGSSYRFMIATKFIDSIGEDKIVFAGNESTKEFRKQNIMKESKLNQKVVEKPMSSDTISDRIDNSKEIRETPEKTFRLRRISHEDASKTRISGTSVTPETSSKSENENLSSTLYSKDFSSTFLDNSANMEDQARHWKTPDANEKEPFQVLFVSSKNQNTKELSQATNLNSRIAIPEVQYLSAESDSNPFMKIMTGPEAEDRNYHESLELDDLTKGSTDNFLQRKSITIDVNPKSDLIIRTGSGKVRIFFDIKNNQMLTTKICYTARGSPIGAFQIYLSNPRDGYCNVVGPGQTNEVVVELIVPNGISDTVNTVILTAQVLGYTGFDLVEKKTYLYVQNLSSRKTDEKSPTINYYFNNNCNGRLKEDRCSKSIWSVDITAQDVDTGLKVVTSSPSGIMADTDYITGTTNPVIFRYHATCCHPTVDVVAFDISGNYNNRRIEVTEWYNLSDGEIAAVVIGVLFIILLIILIVLLIAYCIKTRKSRDLPYTHRYGSRPPAQRPERTSF